MSTSIYRVVHATGALLCQGNAERIGDFCSILPTSVRNRAKKTNMVKGLWLREVASHPLRLYMIVGYRFTGHNSMQNVSVPTRDCIFRNYFTVTTPGIGYWSERPHEATMFESQEEAEAAMREATETKSIHAFGLVLDIHVVSLSVVD